MIATDGGRFKGDLPPHALTPPPGAVSSGASHGDDSSSPHGAKGTAIMGYLAIDFGGTRARAGWFDEVAPAGTLALVQRDETPSQVGDPQAVVIERLIALARSVVPPGASIRAIGVCAPGPLSAERGIIHHAATLPGWRDVPLAALISRGFGGLPVYLHNDANLAALAEYHAGAGRDCDPLIYLTLSTGIGGGAILGGRLFTGWRGLAIEPGHQQCRLPDGSFRRLEELASGTALGAIARQRLQDSDQPSLLRDAHRFPQVDGRAVGQAAQAGDPLALAVVQSAGEWLGAGLVNLLHLFNPRAIVLGGSVSQLGDLLLDPARAVMRARLLSPDFDAPDLLRLAHFGDDPGLIGAAYYAAQQVAGSVASPPTGR